MSLVRFYPLGYWFSSCYINWHRHTDVEIEINDRSSLVEQESEQLLGGYQGEQHIQSRLRVF